MFEWLRFAYSRKRFALHVANEPHDPHGLSPILFGPPRQILERRGVKLNASHKPSFATASSRAIPLVRSRDACKRRFIVSDLRRCAVSRSEAISFHKAIGTITASTATWPGLLKKTEIHGTTGSAIVEQDQVLLWNFEKPKPKDRAVVDKLMNHEIESGGASDPKSISYAGHLDQLKDFVKAIQLGKKPKITGDEGRKAVEIVLAIYQSAWTGKHVSLPLSKDPKRPGGK